MLMEEESIAKDSNGQEVELPVMSVGKITSTNIKLSSFLTLNLLLTSNYIHLSTKDLLMNLSVSLILKLNGSMIRNYVEANVLELTTVIEKEPVDVPTIVNVMDKENAQTENVSEKLTTFKLVIQLDHPVTSSLP